MPDNGFLTALQKVTAGTYTLGELISEAHILAESGQPALAQQLYRVWIGFNRDHPQLYVAYFNCSALDTQLGDAAEAEKALRAAIEINPDFMPAYINLGGVLERSGSLDQAVEQWRTAANRVVRVTGSAVGYTITALKQIARLLAEHQRNELAEAAIRQCLDINPNQRDVIEQFIALRLAQCKWPIVAAWDGMERKALVGSIHPLSMGVYTDDPLLQLAAADHYVRRAVDDKPATMDADRRHAAADITNRRMRIGYVSSDLRDHAIGYLMAELFELHDKAKVEVFAYYCGIPPTGALNARIRAAVEHWTDIRGLSDDAAAEQIAADGIDILVDVNGHTRDSRTGVFARRPAPIQVNWLGFPGSMGTPYHHYIIADEWIIPPGAELYYSERVVRLPCYQPNDRKRTVAQRPTRAEAGLPDDAVVFCCFNGTHKVSRFTFERWLAIMNRVPDSVLWLLDTSAETNDRLRALAEQNGVAGSRLVFAPKLANPHHLARYQLADLFLDTTPYGAHTTASDALWMGVPVLTLSGRGFPSRVCGSLVRSAGLPELVCTRPEDYIERAVELANNPAQLQGLKARLEANRHSCILFDTGKLAANLEALYLDMCIDLQHGRLPQPDLTNLERYFEVGADLDHETQELLALEDYHGLYRAQLERRHLARPLAPDSRLWTAEDIARLEVRTFGPLTAEGPASARRRRQVGG